MHVKISSFVCRHVCVCVCVCVCVGEKCVFRVSAWVEVGLLQSAHVIPCPHIHIYIYIYIYIYPLQLIQRQLPQWVSTLTLSFGDFWCKIRIKMQKRRNAHTHTILYIYIHTHFYPSTKTFNHTLTHTHSCKYAHTSLPCVLTSKCTRSHKPELSKIECGHQMGMGDPNALSFGPALTRVQFCADSTKVLRMRLKITYTH